MAAFNYSKWDNIEISDDESDCHPNIDKASWFRMKHRTRVEREDAEEVEKKQISADIESDRRRVKEIKAIIKEIDEGGDAAEYEDKEALKVEKKELLAKIRERKEKLEYMETHKKWNVDNLGEVTENKTILSEVKDMGPPKKTKVGPESEKEQVYGYADFTETHEALLEEFCVMRDLEEAKEFLHTRGDVLLDEHAQSYLLLSCLEDEMNGLHDKMLITARNSQILSHVSELGQSMNRHPRDVVLPFFHRITQEEYKAGFADAVATFVDRIEKRAVEKRKEMDKERAEEAREEVRQLPLEERLGPGGLDPVEVFESLPQSLQDAFESKDMQKLRDALEALPIAEAKECMDKCEKSGLWVPGGGGDDQDGAEGGAEDGADPELAAATAAASLDDDAEDQKIYAAAEAAKAAGDAVASAL